MGNRITAVQYCDRIGRHDVGSTHSKSGHCRARCAHPRPICIPPIRNGERRRERRGGNGELTISRDGTVRSGSGLGARLRCLARSHRPPGWRSRAPPPAPPKASSHGQRVGGGGSSTRTVARVPDTALTIRFLCFAHGFALCDISVQRCAGGQPSWPPPAASLSVARPPAPVIVSCTDVVPYRHYTVSVCVPPLCRVGCAKG